MSFPFERNDSGSCSLSSIENNSDVSGEDSTEVEVQSQLKGPLDTMDALEDVLPLRFCKTGQFYNKKRKNLLVHGSLLEKNLNHHLRNSENELSIRVADLNGSSTVALGTTMSSSDFNSISSSPSSCLPPLHPQCIKSTMIGSSWTIAHQPNFNPPCLSFSLSALEFAAAVAGATSNIPGFAVHSGNKDNKMR